MMYRVLIPAFALLLFVAPAEAQRPSRTPTPEPCRTTLPPMTMEYRQRSYGMEGRYRLEYESATAWTVVVDDHADSKLKGQLVRRFDGERVYSWHPFSDEPMVIDAKMPDGTPAIVYPEPWITACPEPERRDEIGNERRTTRYHDGLPSGHTERVGGKEILHAEVIRLEVHRNR